MFIKLIQILNCKNNEIVYLSVHLNLTFIRTLNKNKKYWCLQFFFKRPLISSSLLIIDFVELCKFLFSVSKKNLITQQLEKFYSRIVNIKKSTKKNVLKKSLDFIEL